MNSYAEWSDELKERAGKEFTGLFRQMSALVKVLGVEDRVRIDPNVLGKAVIDYIEDIVRLEQYEGIIANTAKIYAYTTYWLLQRNAIMVIRGDASVDTMYINEKVCTAMLISKMQREKEIVHADNQYFVNLLYYNFKYRLYSPQTLELAIEGYFHGCDVGRQNAYR